MAKKAMIEQVKMPNGDIHDLHLYTVSDTNTMILPANLYSGRADKEPLLGAHAAVLSAPTGLTNESYSLATGDYSLAVSYAAMALGHSSAALGYFVNAGTCAFATNRSTTAAAPNSAAFGYDTKTYAHQAFASGVHTEAFGYGSYAGGVYNSAYGYGQTVIGNYAKPTNQNNITPIKKQYRYIFSGRNNNDPITTYSLADVNAESITAIQLISKNSYNPTADSYVESVLVVDTDYEFNATTKTITFKTALEKERIYRIEYTGTGYDTEANELFIVGNGTSTTARSNAFVVGSNGEAIAQLGFRIKDKLGYTYGCFIDNIEGTATTNGRADLVIGNNIASGSAGNARGLLTIYGTGEHAHQIYEYLNLPITGPVNHYLPQATGTIAVGYNFTDTNQPKKLNGPLYMESTGELKTMSAADISAALNGSFVPFTGGTLTGNLSINKTAYSDDNKKGIYFDKRGAIALDSLNDTTQKATLTLRNADQNYVYMRISEYGTTSTIGKAQVSIGNGTAKGTVNNAVGELCIWGESNDDHYIRVNPGATGAIQTTINIPPKASGTLVLSDGAALDAPLQLTADGKLQHATKIRVQGAATSEMGLAGAQIACNSSVQAKGDYSIVTGSSKNKAIGFASSAIGGNYNVAGGPRSFVSGYSNLAKGANSVALGNASTSGSSQSFAFGDNVTAASLGTFATGFNTIAVGQYQTVVGKYNSIEDDTLSEIKRNSNNELPSSLNIYYYVPRPTSTTADSTETVITIPEYYSPTEIIKVQTRNVNGTSFTDVPSAKYTISADNRTITFTEPLATNELYSIHYLGKGEISESNVLFKVGNGTKSSRKDAFQVGADGRTRVLGSLVVTDWANRAKKDATDTYRGTIISYDGSIYSNITQTSNGSKGLFFRHTTDGKTPWVNLGTFYYLNDLADTKNNQFIISAGNARNAYTDKANGGCRGLLRLFGYDKYAHILTESFDFQATEKDVTHYLPRKDGILISGDIVAITAGTIKGPITIDADGFVKQMTDAEINEALLTTSGSNQYFKVGNIPYRTGFTQGKGSVHLIGYARDVIEAGTTITGAYGQYSFAGGLGGAATAYHSFVYSSGTSATNKNPPFEIRDADNNYITGHYASTAGVYGTVINALSSHALGSYSATIGGNYNVAHGSDSFIGSGSTNTAIGDFSAVFGSGNIACSNYQTVVGHWNKVVSGTGISGTRYYHLSTGIGGFPANYEYTLPSYLNVQSISNYSSDVPSQIVYVNYGTTTSYRAYTGQYEITVTNGVCKIKFIDAVPPFMVLNMKVIINKPSTDLFTVGNGSSETARSNAFTVSNDGSAWVGGDLIINGNTDEPINLSTLTETNAQQIGNVNGRVEQIEEKVVNIQASGALLGYEQIGLVNGDNLTGFYLISLAN